MFQIKKLRDSLGMKAIASYYIKTLFLWKVESNDKKYWQKKISVHFREMVEELYNAVNDGKIPYFWNENNNLIQGVRPSLLQLYAKKLKEVLDSIDSNDVEKTIFSLLNTEEINEFKNSEFYKTQEANNINNVSRQASIVSTSSLPSEVDSPKPEKSKDDNLLNIVKSLMGKVDRLTMKVDQLEEKVSELEKEKQRIYCIKCSTISDDESLKEPSGEITTTDRESEDAISDLLIL